MNKIWLLIPALVLAYACGAEQEAPVAPVRPQAEGAISVFYATIESQADSKVYSDANLNVHWDAGDRISIFRKDTGNREYIFTGSTGDNSGEFEELADSSMAAGEALPYFYAVYPYDAGTAVATDGTISCTLPAVQSYRENTFGLGAGTMVAVSEDNFLAFKNVGTLLAIQLYGNGISVAGITLHGNKHEKLAGPATIRMEPGGDPVVTMAGEEASEEVRLVCAEPVALGADSDNAKIFWFVLPPTTFEEGFSITVEDAGGNTYEKSTAKELTLGRNHLSRMKAFELAVFGFGLYPVSGDPYVYNPATDQMNIYEAEGNGWFRFLVPTLKIYELGPIPLDVAQGSTFSATLTVTTAGIRNSSVSYDVTADSFQDGKLDLATAAGDRFIIRF